MVTEVDFDAEPIFQYLSIVAILGTIIAAEFVAHLGNSLGTNINHDRTLWSIAAGGLFAACVLAGFGYVLGMLCAIYDRQERATTNIPVAPNRIPTNSSTTPPPIS